MEGKRYYKPKGEPVIEIKRNLKKGFGSRHFKGMGNFKNLVIPNLGKVRKKTFIRRFF